MAGIESAKRLDQLVSQFQDGHTIVIPRLNLLSKPGRVAQSVRHLTRKSEVLGSIPGPATYFVSPSADSRGVVVRLAKVCARSTS